MGEGGDEEDKLQGECVSEMSLLFLIAIYFTLLYTLP